MLFTKHKCSAIILPKGDVYMDDPKKKYVGVWLPEDMYNKLAAIAKEQDRPLSNYIRNLIKEAIEDR